MKKAIFIGVAALLALAMVSCDFTDKPETVTKPAVEYDDLGRPLITLTTGTNGNRALNDTLAKAGVNFFEVVFAGTPPLRYSWNYRPGDVKILRPEIGPYGAADTAILFAGDAETKTLLAVGRLTSVSTNTTTNTTAPFSITADTTRVGFTLYPLVNDISRTAADTTFKITGITPAAAGFSTTSLIDGGILPRTAVLINGITYRVPVFMLPKNYDPAATPPGGTITATYTLTIPAPAAPDTTTIATLAPGIILSKAPSANIFSVSTDLSLGLGDVKASFTGLPAIASPSTTTLPLTGTAPGTSPALFNLDLTTGPDEGLALLSLSIPVYAVSSAPLGRDDTPPIQWCIRGGTNDRLADAGSRSYGGGVVLGVGVVDLIDLDPGP